MGIRFLKHIERTRVLAIMVESVSSNPRADADVLEAELHAYSPLLADKPRCYILTKVDLCDARPPAELPDGWLWMSSVSGENVDVVLRELARLHGLSDEASP